MPHSNRDSRPIRALIPPRANRVLLISLLALLATGCDLTSPDKKVRLPLPGDASFTVSPSSVSATAVSWNEIDLAWASSPSASGYQVFRSTNGATGAYTQIAQVGANTSSYPNTGLAGSTQYCYEIRSFKVTGRNTTTYGTFSSPACATTAAPPVVAPSETDASPYGGSFRIRWKDNSANEDGFRVEQASSSNGTFSQVTSVGANVTIADVSAQYFEQTVCFRVVAYNSIGPSNPSTPDCTALPTTPNNLSATPLDLQSITVSWSDNSFVEDGYRISRQPQLPGATWAEVATVLPGVNTGVMSYRDATATPDVTYLYHVEAVKDGGFGIASYDVTGLLATTAPAAPANADALFYDEYRTEFGGLAFGISWSDASSNETGFRVEYSADGQSDWSTFVETGPNVSYFSEPYYVPGTGYFRVIAFNNIGASTPSNNTYAESGIPAADFVATALDQQSIDLTWTDNAKLESGYEIFRSTSVDGPYDYVADVSSDATSYHDNNGGVGLDSGQEYWYQVVTIYGNCYSCFGYSNYAAATTPPAGVSPTVAAGVRPNVTRPAPAHPTNLRGGRARAPRRVPGRTR